MELSTKANGIDSQGKSMAEVIKYGATVAFMKVIGKMTKLTVEEGSSTPMEISTTAIGRTTRPMDTESTPTRTEPNTRATGSTISSTVKEWDIGPMVAGRSTMVITSAKRVWPGSLRGGFRARKVLVDAEQISPNQVAFLGSK